MTDHIIRRTRLATDADMPFLMHLQKKWSNAVGFIPRPGFERAITENRILLVEQDAQTAGYLLCSWSAQGMVRVNQLAVEPALLRTTLGTKIMRWLDRSALRGNCSAIRLRCRNDLDANAFWPDAGFVPTCLLIRPSARGRPIIEWTKSLLDPATAMVEHHRHAHRRHRTVIPPVLLDLRDPHTAEAHEIMS